MARAGAGVWSAKVVKCHYPLVNVYIAMTIRELWKITIETMGKSTISMAIFNSYVKLPEGRGLSETYSEKKEQIWHLKKI